jgi:hypothetical protein
VRSFTANTGRGLVRVVLPDDRPPRLMASGRTLREQVPTVVGWDTAGEWVARPTDRFTGRVATTLARAVDGVTETFAEVNVAMTPKVFIAEGRALWGARHDPRSNTVRGFSFDMGEPVAETWAVTLPKLAKACCGRPQIPTPVLIDLYALDFGDPT